jgi:hypothetical protein
MTPVQAAKVVGIRPQMIYGFIKHGRVKTYSNPDGKTALVDLDEVKAIGGGVRHHRPKDPTTGKPVKVTASVKKGDVLSWHTRKLDNLGDGDFCPEVKAHGRMYKLPSGKEWCPHSDHVKPGDRKPSIHRSDVVSELIRNDEDEVTFIRTQKIERTDKGDWVVNDFLWEVGDLSEAISQNRCVIEQPEKLLAATMYSLVHTERSELAQALQLWCEANDLSIPDIVSS